MHITWKGQSCFQIMATPSKGEQVSIVIDPFDDSIGLKSPSLQADILIISDHETGKEIKGNPFLISNPGEYEIKDVFVHGFSFIQKKERNTIYIIETEEIRLCHLNNFSNKEITSEQLEKIGDIDILMIPIGGGDIIDSSQAVKIVSQIEPRIVIPMSYKIPKLKIKLEGVDVFLKAMGQKSAETLDKLLIKKKDLPEGETKVIVLRP